MSRLSPLTVRERLLQAGVSVMSAQGFHGCSVQDITDAATVPKGSFYNHFDSKEGLAAAALDYFWAENACHLLSILDEAQTPPLDRLRRYFEQSATQLEAAGYTCGCFLGNMAAEMSDHSTIVAGHLAAIYQCWTGRVTRCLDQAQQAGTLRREADPAVLATFTLNAWQGAALRARVEKSRAPLQQFIATLFSHVLC